MALPVHPLPYAIAATLGVGIGLAILAGITAIAHVLVYVGLAAFLALAFDPVVRALTIRGLPRWLAAGLLALLLVAVAVGVMFAVVPATIEQFGQFFRVLYALAADVPNQPWFAWLIDNVGASVDLAGALGSITAFLSDPANLVTIAGGILQVGSGLIEGVTGVIVVTVLTVYFLLELPRIRGATFRFVRASRRPQVTEVAEEIFGSVGSYVFGQVLLALANALFTLALTSILGSPSPIFLAVIAFVGALIPVVGTVFGALIAIVATLTVSPSAAIVAAIALLVYMQVEAYVLSPRVMARAVKVPGALVIIAAIAGAALGGVLGAILAVPVVAAGLTVVNRVVLPRQDRR